MKIPGPDHPITIAPTGKRIRVSIGDTVIADTTHALTLKEATYPAVQYIPREDARMMNLIRTDRVTHCSLQGGCQLLQHQGQRPDHRQLDLDL